MSYIDIRSDGSEKVSYDYDGFFAYIRKGKLSSYAQFAADSHWHDDLEFISVLSGEMDYNVNGEILHLTPGQGIFVNARQLHYGFSATQKECEFLCVLLHPMLLCTSQQIESDFVFPILSQSTLPYLFLEEKIGWQKQILEEIAQIFRHKDCSLAPLHIQSSFYHIWILLSQNALQAEGKKGSDRNLSTLKDMISFIQKHHSERVTLDAIAKAGRVSKSSCLLLFKRYLKNTPSHYLTEYRLKRALTLLETTDLSISEIAFDVGFQGTSYFSETFRKKCGQSPSAYRKQIR